MGGLRCPEPTCRAEATPDEVRQCLSAAEWEKFERLALQTSLSSMKDLVWCPRCQYPAMLQEEGGRLALCGECHFSFCAECQQTWHGLAPCANLALRWRSADEAGRARLNGDVSRHERSSPYCEPL